MKLKIRRYETLVGNYWMARDVGAILGFGSKGGNFSRMFTQGMFLGQTAPKKGVHWVLKREDPARDKGPTCVWLTTEGLRHVLQLLYFEGTPYSENAKKMLDELIRMKIIAPVGRPSQEIHFSEVLGAGLEVHFTPKGLLYFIFLDEDDKPHKLSASDLDKGWQEKLIKAIGPWPAP